ncbi:response regulator [Roseobacteraceae bacterium S113]
MSTAVFAIIASIDRMRLQEHLRLELVREAHASAHGLEVAITTGSTLSLGDQAFGSIQRLMLNSPELVSASVNVVSQDQIVTAVASRSDRVGQPASMQSLETWQTGKEIHAFVTQPDGDGHLTLTVPLIVSKEFKGTIELTFTLERLNAELRTQFRSDALALFSLIFLLSGLLYFSIQRMVLSPLWLVQKNIHSFAQSGQIPPKTMSNADEIGALSDSFHDMASSVVETLQKQNETNRLETIGQMTGGVAHDFNNLMSVVSGSLQLLRETQDRTEQDRLFDVAQNSIEHGTNLTRQMLAMGRRSPLKPQPLKANEAVSHFSQFAKSVLPAQISVSVRSDPSDPNILADQSMLQSALLNLVLNAKSAMPDGGEILLSVGLPSPGEVGDGLLDTGPRLVALSVSDTGHGIADPTLDRVFEPFFTTKDVGQGSGLGLSMVKGFAEQSGGFAKIESGRHRGTTVSIYLPRTTRAAKRISASNPPDLLKRHLATSPLILIVEDNAQLLEMLRLKLEKDGCHVETAENGDDALILLERGQYDLVLSDMIMPGNTQGMDVFRKAKSLSDPPFVVLMSGYADAELSQQESPAMADDFIEKPLNLSELSNRLHRLLTEADLGANRTTRATETTD